MKVSDANSVLVFDPRGTVESSNAPIATRPVALGGLRLAILDNSKWNANKILRSSTTALQQSISFGAVNYYVKHSFSKDAAPELIEEIAVNNDLVLTAIGDCGSRSTAAAPSSSSSKVRSCRPSRPWSNEPK